MVLHKFIRLTKWLYMKIIDYKIDNYNENTYNWSQGYRKALQDTLDKINELNNEK